MPRYGSATDDILLVCSGGGHLRQLAGVRRAHRHPAGAAGVGDIRQRAQPIAPRGPSGHPPAVHRTARPAPFLRSALALAGGGVPGSPLRRGDQHGVEPGRRVPAAGGGARHPVVLHRERRASGRSVPDRQTHRGIRSIQTFTQYPSWANARWQFRGSIFDEFVPSERPSAAPEPRTAVVTVGTQEGGYPFERMLRAVMPLVADFDEVLWQTGDADVSGGLGIHGIASLPHEDLSSAMARADVVVSHAGVGSALTALRAGKHPILVPREAEHGEHVDDHQVQIARELERRGPCDLRSR